MNSIARHLHAFQATREPLWLKKSGWIGMLALLGAMLLAGASLSWAATAMTGNEEKLLAGILQQLQEQGKKVKTANVVNAGKESEVVVMLMDGSVKRYDDQGRLKFEKDANGKTMLYENGLPSEERDGRGNLIAKFTYEQSASGDRKKMVKHSRMGTETKISDAKGNVIQVTNQNGTKLYTNYVKNDQGKTVSYVEKDLNSGKSTLVLQDPQTGEVTAKIDQSNVRTDIENIKDANGQLLKTIEKDTAGNVTVKNYQQEQLVSEEKNGITTTYENVLGEKGELAQVIEKKFLPAASGTVVETTVKTFDEAGRIKKMTDKEGEHEFTYDVNADGRMAAEREVVRGLDGKITKDAYKRFDEFGRVISLVENGRETKTTYILDEKGNVRAAIDSITQKFNGQTFSQTIRKEYDDQNREISRTDHYGVRTEFSYDGQGNRKQSKNEFETTLYYYDLFNNMIASRTEDHKSVSYTRYDKKSKLAENVVKVMNSGVLYITDYSINGEGKRVAYEYGPFGIKVTVYRNATSEQPETMTHYKYNGKVITTVYQYAGESMVSSKENGPAGETVTHYNLYQKPQHQERIDQFGKKSVTEFEYKNGRMAASLMVDPKGKTTTEFNKYEDPARIIRENTIGFPRKSVEERRYDRGMLTSSESTDFRGKSITTYDENEMAASVHRINHHGFPRENIVTNIYDGGGDVIETLQVDKRGTTHNWLDKDGLQEKSVRLDIHGFPKEKTTTYQYVKGELVTSDTVDERGQTHNTFDQDGLMRTSHRKKLFGFPREEKTEYQYDENGFMTYSLENDENGSTESYYNIDEVVDTSLRRNLYGHARDQWTKYIYDGDGYMTMSKENDLRGVTVTNYDIDSLATDSMRYDKFGVQYSRETLTYNDYDEKGFLTVSNSKNLMGTTEKTVDRDGLTRKLVQDDNFGLAWSRHKLTEGYEYDEHGRVQQSVERDMLGSTISKYDIHGDAVWSRRMATTGINFARNTVTESTYKDDTGMTTHSLSTNTYGTTESLDYDPMTGLAGRQISNTNFGLTGSRRTETKMDMDVRHGLTRESYAHNDLGDTHTVYDTVSGGRFGVSDWSETKNKYGLGFTRSNATRFTVNTNNGLNISTKSTSAYGKTTTMYDDKQYGVATSSITDNNFGLTATRHNQISEGDMLVNKDNGLNISTKSVSEYGTTVTQYDDKVYGISVSSVSDNNFGLGATRHSEISPDNMQVNTFNGLNIKTKSVSKYGTTVTQYDDKAYGVAVSSATDNFFGLKAARHSEVKTGNMLVNLDNGLNQYTKSESAYGSTESWYEDAEYGVSTASRTVNQFGLGLTRVTTVGQTGSRERGSDMQVNTHNGLNQYTRSLNGYATTESWYDDAEYGVSTSSKTVNKFGLGLSRVSTVGDPGSHSRGRDLVVNVENGLNQFTRSVSNYATTESWYDDAEYGVSTASRTTNNYGLGLARVTTIGEAGSRTRGSDMVVNVENGLNQFTRSVNKYATTESWYDDAAYGVSTASRTTNNFGLGLARVTTVGAPGSRTRGDDLVVNTDNGLNQFTRSVNGYATTESWYDDAEYGVSTASKTVNKFGLGLARVSTVGEPGSRTRGKDLVVNTDNGLNNFTRTLNGLATTESWYDDAEYGVATSSKTVNKFGLGLTRVSTVGTPGSHARGSDMVVNLDNGLNQYTKSMNGYATAESWYDDAEYGVATSSKTVNKFGLGFTRVSTVGIPGSRTRGNDLVVNTDNGLNRFTKTINDYATSESWFDDAEYGVATSSKTVNNFGLGLTRVSTVGTPGSHARGEDLVVNTENGLNIFSKSVSGYATSESWFDDAEYGVATSSRTTNKFGLTLTRVTTVGTPGSRARGGEMVVNTDNGLNRFTKSMNGYATTESWFDDAEYGVSTATRTQNKFGLGLTRMTTVGTPDSHKRGQDLQVNTNNGLNVYTRSLNGYATTESWYDDAEYGVSTASKTVNKFGLGFTRTSTVGTPGSRTRGADLVVNTDNGMNQYTRSVSAYATSESWFDDAEYGVPTSSKTVNNFGLGLTRVSTVGAPGSAVRGQDLVVNTANGLNQYTKSKSGYATTESWYDDAEYGVSTASKTVNNFGLGLTRTSTVGTPGSRSRGDDLQVNTDNGLNQFTRSISGYGTTESWYDDAEYGVSTASKTVNNFGLGFTRTSTVGTPGSRNRGNDLQVNTDNGLNQYTKSVNAYATTESWYDDAEYGVSTASKTVNNYGLGLTRTSTVGTPGSRSRGQDLVVNTDNGLNQYTRSVSGYATTESWYDDAAYGVSTASKTVNNFGLGFTRLSTIGTPGSRSRGNDLQVNTDNGLNQFTKSVSKYATTESWYDDAAYGVSTASKTVNNFGLGLTRTTTVGVPESRERGSDLVVNTDNGLNMFTRSVNGYATTESWYDDAEYGVSTASRTTNKFGLGLTRVTTVGKPESRTRGQEMVVNTDNGLNYYTKSVNGYATTESWYDDKAYGVSTASKTVNNFGLGFTRQSTIGTPGSHAYGEDMVVNTDNGLNVFTRSVSKYATTESWYDDAEYGVSTASKTLNHYGLGFTRLSTVGAPGSHSRGEDMVVNTENGLNVFTRSVSKYATTESWYDDAEYGVSTATKTVNNFGLGLTRVSTVGSPGSRSRGDDLVVNTENGLNQYTKSKSGYATTESWYDDAAYGVSTSSKTVNNFGLGLTRTSTVGTPGSHGRGQDMVVNTDNGLNYFTRAVSGYATTESWYDDAEYGVSTASKTMNNFGLGFTRVTTVGTPESHVRGKDMQVNTDNGLNQYTRSVNAYATTESWYDDAEYGVSTASKTVNNFGLGFTRASTVGTPGSSKRGPDMVVNTDNGLNQYTRSVSKYGTTQSWYDDAEYGVSTASRTVNNYGLGLTRESTIGTPESRVRGTDMVVNVENGLNQFTKSVSGYGTTESWYDDAEYGVSTSSRTANLFGLMLTRVTTVGTPGSRERGQDMMVNTDNGLNQFTRSESGYGVTDTWYDDAEYGVSTASKTMNNYGLGFTRVSTVGKPGSHSREGDMVVNTDNGLNYYTKSVNLYATTESWYDDAEYGVSTASRTMNYFGLGFTRLSTVGSPNSHERGADMVVNTDNGLNQYTRAVSRYATTKTWYDDAEFGVSTSSETLNNFGLGFTRLSTVGTPQSRNRGDDMVVNVNNGLNIYTKSVSTYGTTESWYDDAEFGVSTATKTLNNYGLGWTRLSTVGSPESRERGQALMVNTDNGLNQYTKSLSEYGATETWYDDAAYGVSTSSKTVNKVGLGFSRESTIGTLGSHLRGQDMVVNTDNGLNYFTKSISLYATTESWYDDAEYGVSTASRTHNNFGLGFTRLASVGIAGSHARGGDMQVNTDNGLNQYTKSLSTDRGGSKLFSTTETWYDDAEYGVSTSSKTLNEFGLGYTRMATVGDPGSKARGQEMVVNTDNGLNIFSRSRSTDRSGNNLYSTTESWYDDVDYGVSTASRTKNEFGLGFTRMNRIGQPESHVRGADMVVNTDNGLNQYTKSLSSDEGGGSLYSTTESWYDDAEYGVSTSSKTANEFGLAYTRLNTVGDPGSHSRGGDMVVNTDNGLNYYTKSLSRDKGGNNLYSTTESWYDDAEYGVSTSSRTGNEFGLGFTRLNTVGSPESHVRGADMVVNTNNGLNQYTKAISTDRGGNRRFSTTESWYDDAEYGVSTASRTANEFGLGYTRLNSVGSAGSRSRGKDMVVNTNNGLNQYTRALSTDAGGKTLYSTAETWYDDAVYGVSTASRTVNEFGLGFTRLNMVGSPESHARGADMVVNTNNGLNNYTRAVSQGKGGTRYSVSESWYDDAEYGVTTSSKTANEFGLGFTRLNTVGAPGSHARGNEMVVNTDNGLNVYTKSLSQDQSGKQLFSTAETWYDDAEYGVSTASQTANEFGLGFTALNTVGTPQSHARGNDMVVNTNNGLNYYTKSSSTDRGGANLYCTTESWYDDVTYGVSTASRTKNEFGLGFTRLNKVGAEGSHTRGDDMVVNTDNGLNQYTKSTSTDSSGQKLFSTTMTWYDDAVYGVSTASKTLNEFGLGFTRMATVGQEASHSRGKDMVVNTDNGLNQYTRSISRGREKSTIFSTTESWYDDAKYGVTTASRTKNEFGLGYTRLNTVGEPESHARGGDMLVNTDNGLNQYTKTLSKDAGGSLLYSTAETWYDDAAYGVSTSSKTVNEFGLGFTRLNRVGQPGSHAIGTDMVVNTDNGLNHYTKTVSQDKNSATVYSTTESWYDDLEYGVSTASLTENEFGLGFTRQNRVGEPGSHARGGEMVVNTDNGLNYYSKSVSKDHDSAQIYSTTETWFDDQVYGVSTASRTVNEFGLGFTRLNTVGTAESHARGNDMVVNTNNGLNQYTRSISRGKNNGTVYSTTESWYDDAAYGVSTSSKTVNEFGLGFTRYNTVGAPGSHARGSEMMVNTDNGLNQYTKTMSRGQGGQTYSTTESWYDDAEYGVSTSSKTANEFGLTFTRLNTVGTPGSHARGSEMVVNTDNGLNYYTKSVSQSQNGSQVYSTTESWYDDAQYGVATASETLNEFGLGFTRMTKVGLRESHALGADMKVNTDNGLNQYTRSISKDRDGAAVFSTTESWYDDAVYGVSTSSKTLNEFGLGFTRENTVGQPGSNVRGSDLVVNTDNGLNSFTKSINLYATSETWFDHAEYGVSTSSRTTNNFGLGWTRINTVGSPGSHSIDASSMEVNTSNGLNRYTKNVAGGPGGKPLFSTTESWYDDAQYGVSTSSKTVNEFGLGLTRISTVGAPGSHARGDDLVVNTDNGLNYYTEAKSDYAVSKSWYDDVEYGVTTSSQSENKFGLGYTRLNTVGSPGNHGMDPQNMSVNTDNGLNQFTRSIATDQGGGNVFSTTESWYEDATYGVSTSSRTVNTFGLGFTRLSTIGTPQSRSMGNDLVVNTNNGLNYYTKSISAYATTETWYDDKEFGVSTSSKTLNNYGLGYTRENTMGSPGSHDRGGDMVVNTENGLNQYTRSISRGQGSGTVFSTTQSWYDDAQYGVSTSSRTVNEFGLGLTRESTIGNPESRALGQDMVVNTNNGLNIYTKSICDYSVTESWYDDAEYGVSTSSQTANQFGLLYTRMNVVGQPGSHARGADMVVNTDNGLNYYTRAISRGQGGQQYSETQTWYNDAEFGVATASKTVNVFGLGYTRINTVGAENSHSFGADMKVNTNNGLNQYTRSVNAYGTNETWYDEAEYGVSTSSRAQNNYGLGYTRQNTVGSPGSSARGNDMQVNTDNGLNRYTKSLSKSQDGSVLYSTAESWYDDAVYGVTTSSSTVNEFGLGYTRLNTVGSPGSRAPGSDMKVNVSNGLNYYTKSVSKSRNGSKTYSTAETWYDDAEFGVATASKTMNEFGLTMTRETTIGSAGSHGRGSDMVVNTNNGLNFYTRSVSDYGVTESWFDDAEFGVTTASKSVNKYGLGFTLESTVGSVGSHSRGGDMLVNTNNGLNYFTKSISLYATTETWYEDQEYGVSTATRSLNNYGLGFTRMNTSGTPGSHAIGRELVVNTDNGLNNYTKSVSKDRGGAHLYSTTESWFDDRFYGVTTSSFTVNEYGLGFTRESTVGSKGSHSLGSDMVVNTANGLNRYTRAVSKYGVTKTWYDDGKFGVATSSWTKNNFGLGLARESTVGTPESHSRGSDMQVNTDNGLNVFTKSVSEYSTTESWYDHAQFGVTTSSRTMNNFGLGYTRKSIVGTPGSHGFNHSAMIVNTDNGLNYYTKARNQGAGGELFSTTESWYEDQHYGISTASKTKNEYGLRLTRIASVGAEGSHASGSDMKVNTDNGLNQYTKTINKGEDGRLFSTTETWYEDKNHGVTTATKTLNEYGLHWTRINEVTQGNMQVNTDNGLTIYNKSVSRGAQLYSTTESWYDDKAYGVLTSSRAKNEFGLGYTRQSLIGEPGSHSLGNGLQVNTNTGLNISTTLLSKGLNGTLFSTTVTNYEQRYGTAETSTTTNVFGLLSTLVTDTALEVNFDNGLNKKTVAVSGYGTTETKYEHDITGATGVALRTESWNNFGLGLTRHSWINQNEMLVNKNNGLNIQTTNRSEYGYTISIYDDQSYGTCKSSVTHNNFGLGFTRDSHIDEGDTWKHMRVNKNTGLNVSTYSQSTYGNTYTSYDQQYGTADSSKVWNNFGVEAARYSWSNAGEILVNHYTGLNEQTTTHSDYADTTTYYDSASYGVAESSFTHNNRGLGSTRDVNTQMKVNVNNGLNQETSSSSGYGDTFTKYDDRAYGIATSSTTSNNFGVGYAQNSEIRSGGYKINTDHGLTEWSKSYTIPDGAHGGQVGWTETYYTLDDKGYSDYSLTYTPYGPPAGQESRTEYTVNNFGMNTFTHAETALGTTDTWFNEIEGTVTRYDSHNYLGPEYGRDTTTTIDQVNTWSGIYIKTTADNRLSTTVTDDYDQTYGTARHSVTINKLAISGSKRSETNTVCDNYTGMNYTSHTVTGTTDKTVKTSTTDTLFNTTTGAQESSVVVMEAWFTLLGAVRTSNSFESYDTNMLKKSTAVNNLGTTITDYDNNGLSYRSENRATHGLSKYTETYDINNSLQTGMLVDSHAKSYTDESKAHMLCQVDSEADAYGIVTKTITTNTYGCDGARETTTIVDTYDDITGNRKQATSTNRLGTSVSTYDIKGVEVQVTSDSKIGPTMGRHVVTNVQSYHQETGARLSAYSESQLNKSWNYYDANGDGLPSNAGYASINIDGYGSWSGNVHSQKNITYASAEGDQYEIAMVGGLHWNGNISTLQTWTHITNNVIEQDEDGVATRTESFKVYGANGSAHSITETQAKDAETGIVTQNVVQRLKTNGDGDGKTTQYFETAYGLMTKSYDHKNEITTTQENNNDTGLFKSSEASKGGDYNHKLWCNSGSGVGYSGGGAAYTSTGLPNKGYTCQAYKDGKKKKYKKYWSQYWYNGWTGLMTREKQTPNEDGSGKVTWKYYDAHGVETKEEINDTDYPDGEAQQVTEYTGRDADNMPTAITATYGEVRTEIWKEFKINTKDGQNSYYPVTLEIQNHFSAYAPTQTIQYLLNGEYQPTRATVTDNQGYEIWILNNEYAQAAQTSRTRYNQDGSLAMKWDYSGDTVQTDALFHQSADLTIRNYMGAGDFTGTEMSNKKGIRLEWNLSSGNAMNESVVYQNDGTNVISATSTREDSSVAVMYMNRAGEIVSMSDDMAVHTMDASTGEFTSATGFDGTQYTYSYDGRAVRNIIGVGPSGQTRMDGYRNIQSWTDTQGVEHTYSAKSKNKSYWTEANEQFNSNGTVWTGVSKRGAYGREFAGATLEAQNADLSQKGADNIYVMDKDAAVGAVQNLVKKYQVEKETFTWAAPTDTRKAMTSGEIRAQYIDASDITGKANVKVTINPDGSYSAEMQNLRFLQVDLVKTNRCKPEEYYDEILTTQSGEPSAGDFRNMTLYNNPYLKPDMYNSIGYIISGVSSYQVEDGSHTETVPVLDAEDNQVYDEDGNALTEEVTVTDYVTEWSYRLRKYRMVSDGYEFIVQGSVSENYYGDTINQTGGGLKVAPYYMNNKRVGAASVRSYTASKPAQGVTLGYVAPTAVKVAAKVDPNQAAQSAAVDNGKIQAASVAATPSTEANNVQAASAAATPEAGQVQAAAVEAAKVPAVPATTPVAEVKTAATSTEGKDELLAKFQAVRSLGDLAKFYELMAASLGNRGIAEGLKNSGAAGLFNAVVKTYKALFGEGYKKSVVGKLIALATSEEAVREEVRIALEGGKEMPNEVRMAAKIAKQVQEAKSVTRDEEGKPVEVVDKDGAVHKLDYDDSGITETVTTAEGKSKVLRYDQQGRLLSETGDGKTKTYAYRMDNQRVNQVLVTERSSSGIVTMVYDSNGRLTSMERDGKKTVVTYQSEDQYTAVVFGSSGEKEQELIYRQGQLAQVLNADGGTITFEYMVDSTGKVLAMVQTVVDKDGQKTISKYNSEGRLISALGKDASRFQRTTDKDTEETLTFEMEKSLFGDPRLQDSRLDIKVLELQEY